MKKYTQAEFNRLPVVGGIRQCPTGDYTRIKKFGSWCHFGNDCVFGDDAKFGEWCSFDDNCKFGDWCHFGNDCNFGKSTKFGVHCVFGSECIFGNSSTFDNFAKFGHYNTFSGKCIFGNECTFGNNNRFGKSCWFEGRYKAKTSKPLMMISYAGSINRATYFFDTVEGVIVRSGCFVGTLAEFRAKVLTDVHGNKTSIKALQYLGFANIVAATWAPELIEV